MGFTDAEGFLTLKDRSKDMIISGGSNIYPRELEEVLLTHPMVLECAVIGREHPEWGEEVVAFVVARPEHDDHAPGSRRPLPRQHRTLQAAAAATGSSRACPRTATARSSRPTCDSS